jgi:uncharacterized protein involved in exopolysaccharide biosynthesis
VTARSQSERTLNERHNDYDASSGRAKAGSPVDVIRLWVSLKRRWQVVLVCGIVGAFLGAAIAKKLTKQTFEATAVLGWDTKATTERSERISLVEAITLPSVYEEVARRLKVEEVGRDLERFVAIGTSEQSNNVTVTATWSTGDGASRLANTMVDVFMESRSRAIRERNQATAGFYREQVAEAEKQRAKAAEEYERFRRQSGVADITGERGLAINQYADLATQLSKMRTAAAGTRTPAVGGPAAPTASAGSAPSLSAQDAKAFSADQERLVTARAELNRARVQFAEDHPNVRRLAAEVESLEARIRAYKNDSARQRDNGEASSRLALARQKAAEDLQGELKARLEKLSTVEAQAAVLLGDLKVAEEAKERARELLIETELQAKEPRPEFAVLDRAKEPKRAKSSPRKKVAIGVPVAMVVLGLLGVLAWPLRKLDVCTPKEAAFWSGVPVVGASTWPRDPDMLASLMHDLDDFAPHAQGVTLIVGLSVDEAQLARKVADWDGQRLVQGGVHDPQLRLGAGASQYPLAVANGRSMPPSDGREPTGSHTNMQILSLTGPVPAQALRRAARLADRVLVVVSSAKHSFFQLQKIRALLGRDDGIGLLLVGLEKDYALVRDRVGAVDSFWSSVRNVRAGQTERPDPYEA